MNKEVPEKKQLENFVCATIVKFYFTNRKPLHKESKDGWVITCHNFKGGYQQFGGTQCTHLQVEGIYKTIESYPCNRPLRPMGL
jgi:hypothetical protein